MKKIVFYLLLVLPMCLLAQTPTNLVPPSARINELVTWIDAEEQTGIDGSVISNITDQAGIVTGISIEGSITLNISPSGHKEFNFAGSGNAINLGRPAQLNFLPGTDEFTIMGFLGSGVPTTGSFVSKGVNFDNFQYQVDITSNRYWTSIGDTYGYLDSTMGLIDENQHFTLVVYQSEIKLYLDGQLIQTKANSVGTGTIDVDVLIGAKRNNESTNSGIGYEYAEHLRNIGIFSKALSATEIQNIYNDLTSSGSDTQAPIAPALTSGSYTDTTLNLSWSGATDNIGVTGYRVYKNGVLETTLGNVGTYQVTGLTASTGYNFNVSALDASGNESVFSNQVSITTNATSGGGGTSSVWTENSGVVSYTGDVAVGTASVPAGYKLAVEGKIRTREVRVDQDNWPDYVFSKDHKLPTLEEIEQYIMAKGHLPNMPSASEVETNGIALGEMNRLLLEKIEELTLYILQQEEVLSQQQLFAKQLFERIESLEKSMNYNNKEQ